MTKRWLPGRWVEMCGICKNYELVGPGKYGCYLSPGLLFGDVNYMYDSCPLPSEEDVVVVEGEYDHTAGLGNTISGKTIQALLSPLRIKYGQKVRITIERIKEEE